MVKTLSALPVIGTPRLRLAAFALKDAAALQQLTDDPAITGAIDFLKSPFSLTDAQALIRQDGSGRDLFIGAWRRADGDAGQLIGTIGTHLRGEADIEVGYWIGRAWHGKGYGREAVGGVVAMLAAEFPERRIVAECRRENTASWRLLVGLGFAPTGAAGLRPGRHLLALR